jgi:hypothetical protein
MRYLKKYDKLFESEVVNNCEDILLELDDQGFITNVIHTPRYPKNRTLDDYTIFEKIKILIKR